MAGKPPKQPTWWCIEKKWRKFTQWNVIPQKLKKKKKTQTTDLPRNTHKPQIYTEGKRPQQMAICDLIQSCDHVQEQELVLHGRGQGSPSLRLEPGKWTGHWGASTMCLDDRQALYRDHTLAMSLCMLISFHRTLTMSVSYRMRGVPPYRFQCFVSLRQGLLYPRLSSHSLWCWGWPWTSSPSSTAKSWDCRHEHHTQLIQVI